MTISLDPSPTVTEFAFGEELDELRSMVRKFASEFSSEGTVRDTMETDLGYDPALWRRLGSELGILGLSVPADLGGDAAGLVAQAVAVEELGAALVCGPVVGTLALAIPALSALRDREVATQIMGDLIAGLTTATVVFPLSHRSFDASAVTFDAEEASEGWRLSGSLDHVPDGSAADTLLVFGRTAVGISLFSVDASTPEVRREAMPPLDLTRRQAVVELASAPATLLAGPDEVPDIWEAIHRVASVLIAAEQVGGSQAMLNNTVEYAKGRLQFGQAIGSFQAVKHKCADMLIAVEHARSVAYHGAWALQNDLDDHALASSLARVVASETFHRVSATSIQLHGGIGFSWEHPAHLYFKRAVTDSALLGNPDGFVDAIGSIALDDGAGS